MGRGFLVRFGVVRLDLFLVDLAWLVLLASLPSGCALRDVGPAEGGLPDPVVLHDVVPCDAPAVRPFGGPVGCEIFEL